MTKALRRFSSAKPERFPGFEFGLVGFKLGPSLQKGAEESFGLGEGRIRLFDVGVAQPSVDVNVKLRQTGGDVAAGLFVKAHGEFLNNGAGFGNGRRPFAYLAVGQRFASQPYRLYSATIKRPDEF